MFYLEKVFSLLIFVWSHSFGGEFYSSETFKPVCTKNGKLFINEAFYGRKNFGKCVEKESENIEALSKISVYINCYTGTSMRWQKKLRNNCVKDQCKINLQQSFSISFRS